MQSYRDVFAVESSEEYERRHRNMCSGGKREIAVHVVLGNRRARVDHARWLIDCGCGSGAIIDTDLDTPVARCFECGAVHHGIEIPPRSERREIEAVLDARGDDRLRHWIPPETIADLRAENTRHGV